MVTCRYQSHTRQPHSQAQVLCAIPVRIVSPPVLHAIYAICLPLYHKDYGAENALFAAAVPNEPYPITAFRSNGLGNALGLKNSPRCCLSVIIGRYASLFASHMHRCLQVHDILAHIAELACDQHDFRRRNRTAISFALTCRWFLDVGLDESWQELENILPLLKTLPEDLWEIRTGETYWGSVRIRTFAFTRSPTPLDWVRFESYASRVRRLGIQRRSGRFSVSWESPFSGVDSDVCQALLDYKPNALLPNLGELAWSVSSELFCHLPQFVGDKTRLLRVNVRGDAGELLHLQSILDAAPPIQDLRIFSHQTLDCQQISSFVCQFQRLRSLQVSFPLSDKAILYLSSFPHLTSLDIALNPADVQASLFTNIVALGLPHNRIPFQSLESLTIYCRTETHCVDFLQCMDFPRLRRFSLLLGAPPATPGLMDCFTALQRAASAALHTLNVEEETPRDLRLGSSQHHVFDARLIAPLLKFPTLKYLRIDATCSFDIGNAETRDMATAWPKVEHIELGMPGGWGTGSRITLDGLILFAKYCPNLKYLGIVIEPKIIPRLLGSDTGVEREQIRNPSV
ncbi:hypothetical protein JAAARDRAFT_199304 [Jaapia argillacea MUCL 33604]|uniref:F-box domain-containing protein n=1 Tax=Jaapia argillacea MUCL 33604 TaxID=933084 RepID=A0A067PJT0_9AGAM|nr:hypothetical protein JAAARDRAFT_199304 [Jaapia argillacea MUCL 33604]